MRKIDILLLPAIVIVTALAVIVPTEFGLRMAFPANEFDQCVNYKDTSAQSFHARPNCVSRVKVPESPWVQIRHNMCGFRQDADCGPKRPNALRFAVIGSSLSAGYLVPQNETMSVRATNTLSQICRAPVDFQNLGAEGNLGPRLYASASAAVNLAPDVLVYVVSPTDLQLSNSADQANALEDTGKRQTNLMRELKVAISSLRVFYMESYMLLRNDDNYVPIYLTSGHNADFMRSPLSTEWLTKLDNLDADVSRLGETAHKAGVPFLVLYVPQRAEAAIHATPRLGTGVDEELLPRMIEQIVLAHGGHFANVTKDIVAGTPSSSLYYAMNGHINGAGNAIMAKTLVDGIMNISSSRFAAECGPTDASVLSAGALMPSASTGPKTAIGGSTPAASTVPPVVPKPIQMPLAPALPGKDAQPNTGAGYRLADRAAHHSYATTKHTSPVRRPKPQRGSDAVKHHGQNHAPKYKSWLEKDQPSERHDEIYVDSAETWRGHPEYVPVRPSVEVKSKMHRAAALPHPQRKARGH